MFAICLGRVELRELAELSPSRAYGEEPSMGVCNPIRYAVRDAWDKSAYLAELVLRKIWDSLRTE